MKKVVLSAMALMIGAAMVAQVDTSGDVAPAYAPSNVAPSAAGANTGLTQQDGTNNKIRVRQAGTSQDVYSVQGNGLGNGGNLAKVMQTGAVNTTSGIANKANVFQLGTANQSNTIQEGDENKAITKQG